MTEQEFNIKTAELCGYEFDGYLHDGSPDLSYYGIVWNPRESIEQMMKVLEAFEDWQLTKFTMHDDDIVYECEIEVQKAGCISMDITKDAKSKEEAIFQAVKSYLEGEGNGE